MGFKCLSGSLSLRAHLLFLAVKLEGVPGIHIHIFQEGKKFYLFMGHLYFGTKGFAIFGPCYRSFTYLDFGNYSQFFFGNFSIHLTVPSVDQKIQLSRRKNTYYTKNARFSFVLQSNLSFVGLLLFRPTLLLSI